MAQTELHDLVIRRLAAALESARPADGPCYRISSDIAVRFADTPAKNADHRLNVRYPDIIVRDCDPYDVNTVRDHIQLATEVTSETTFDADTSAKRALYASAGIPGYLVVHFDKDWTAISQPLASTIPLRLKPGASSKSPPSGNMNASAGSGMAPPSPSGMTSSHANDESVT